MGTYLPFPKTTIFYVLFSANGHASYQGSHRMLNLFDIPGDDAEDSINDEADDGEVSACGGDSLPV